MAKTVMFIEKLLLSFGQCIVGRRESTVKSLLFDRCGMILCTKNWQIIMFIVMDGFCMKMPT